MSDLVFRISTDVGRFVVTVLLFMEIQPFIHNDNSVVVVGLDLGPTMELAAAFLISFSLAKLFLWKDNNKSWEHSEYLKHVPVHCFAKRYTTTRTRTLVKFYLNDNNIHFDGKKLDKELDSFCSDYCGWLKEFSYS